MFAKLYEKEGIGQVLVKLDNSEKGPEIRYYFVPEGLGVCSVAVEFNDNADSWDKADAAFERVNEEQAIQLAREMIQKMAEAV